MIKAVFYKKNGAFRGFGISGHSGYAESGSDIVCASVSSAAMLTANTVTDFFGADAKAYADGNLFELMLNKDCDRSEKLIESFYQHLDFISQDYNGTIRLSVMEV
ncbi:MAG: ribosomal-processing cysteine protease Prp [Oscillospiraceae bacterium]|nr:ribosomal-processing cysteine protease Prp [Oscillospiraceae bacterium]